MATQTLAVASLSSPAASLVTQQFDPYTLLEVFVFIPSLSILSIPRLRFNLDTGTTAYAYSISDNFGIPVTGIAGVASGIALAPVNITSPVGAKLLIGNGPSQQHIIMLQGMTGVVDASAAPHVISGSGVWSTTSQIQSVQLDAGLGGGNLGAGTGLLVIGTNP